MESVHWLRAQCRYQYHVRTRSVLLYDGQVPQRMQNATCSDYTKFSYTGRHLTPPNYVCKPCSTVQLKLTHVRKKQKYLACIYALASGDCNYTKTRRVSTVAALEAPSRNSLQLLTYGRDPSSTNQLLTSASLSSAYHEQIWRGKRERTKDKGGREMDLIYYLGETPAASRRSRSQSPEPRELMALSGPSGRRP